MLFSSFSLVLQVFQTTYFWLEAQGPASPSFVWLLHRVEALRQKKGPAVLILSLVLPTSRPSLILIEIETESHTGYQRRTCSWAYPQDEMADGESAASSMQYSLTEGATDVEMNHTESVINTLAIASELYDLHFGQEEPEKDKDKKR